MATEELYASDFMEALLRATLILSDRRRSFAGEIWILSCSESETGRHLRARCRITPEPDGQPPSGARIEIVYPEASNPER